MLSPWVTFDTSSDSFQKNKSIDILLGESAITQSKVFLGEAPPDSYVVPREAPVEWWNSLNVKSIYMLVGDCECFQDDVVALGEVMKVISFSFQK